jgi:DNA processing protein
MCIPGVITNPNTEGIYKLLKNGATLVTCAQDILEALNWEIKPAEQLKIDLSGLNTDEQKIVEFLEIEEKGFDEILNQTGINTNDLLILLTTLELKGIIKQTAGDRYKKI